MSIDSILGTMTTRASAAVWTIEIGFPEIRSLGRIIYSCIEWVFLIASQYLVLYTIQLYSHMSAPYLSATSTGASAVETMGTRGY